MYRCILEFTPTDPKVALKNLYNLISSRARGLVQALTYHVGVNTLSKPFKGYSPVIDFGKFRQGFWIPLTRSIDHYMAEDLCYNVRGYRVSLCSIISYSLAYKLLEYKGYDTNAIVKHHIDPEFMTYTYGDFRKYGALRKLTRDKTEYIIIFFIGNFKDCICSKYDGCKCPGKGYWGILGHITAHVSNIIELYRLLKQPRLSVIEYIFERFRYNAHLTRAFARRNLVMGNNSFEEALYTVTGMCKRADVEAVAKKFLGMLFRHTRILVSGIPRYSAYYTVPIKVWRQRSRLYKYLVDRGIILKQVMHSQAYVRVNPANFIEWLLARLDEYGNKAGS